MTSLTLVLTRLPALKRVGGNTRHRTWLTQWLDFQAEKDAWLAMLNNQIPSPSPKFDKAVAHVTLVFAQDRARDDENLRYGLKPLWDCLTPAKWKRKGYKTGLGILADDDRKHLRVELDVTVNKQLAPRTIVQITEEGEGDGYSGDTIR